MCDNIKDVLYKPIAQDSRNMAKMANATGFDWLEDEGNKNTKNPGRAAGKAAGYAASWYAGGLLGSGAGAGANAAVQAGEETAKTAAEQAAIEAAKQAAMEAAQQGGGQAAIEASKQATLEAMKNGTVMEAGITNTGYTPSSLYQALKNAGDTTPLKQNLMNYAKQQMTNAGNGGLLNTISANAKDPQSQQMMKTGMGLLSPQQPQGPPRMPPPQQGGQPQPLSMPYQNTDLNSMKPPGMSMEEWLKRKQMGLLGGM